MSNYNDIKIVHSKTKTDDPAILDKQTDVLFSWKLNDGSLKNCVNR